MGQTELKPCQASVRGTIRWKDSFQDNYSVCEAYCKKYERHASEQISKENQDGLLALLVERDVMRELCKGCKEAIDDGQES